MDEISLKRLNDAFTDSDLTREELATIGGTNVNTLRNYLSGVHDMNTGTFKSFCVKLGLDPYYILGIKNDENLNLSELTPAQRKDMRKLYTKYMQANEILNK